jgi:hypothetical protein
MIVRTVSRIVLFLALFTLLLSLPVSAQDESTVEPTVEATVVPLPDEVIVVPVEDGDDVVIIREDEGFRPRDWMWVIVLGFFAFLLSESNKTNRAALVEAGRSVPAPVAEMIFGAGTAGLDAAGAIVAATPTKADDEILAELRRDFDRFKAEVRARTPDEPVG